MGIDIYASWAGQTDAEKEAQHTAFDTERGHLGYLRESYHGSPYATRILVPEAFAAKNGRARIRASKLRARLPVVATAALVRLAQVYGNANARNFLAAEVKIEPSTRRLAQVDVDTGGLLPMLARIFTQEIPAAKGDQPSFPPLDPPALKRAAEFSGPVRSFVDFVLLCQEKEAATGKPCSIVASY